MVHIDALYGSFEAAKSTESLRTDKFGGPKKTMFQLVNVSNHGQVAYGALGRIS